ncbi:hypothetical protein LWI29_001228 [Acer saccharum]|uniref:Uncharacterized protein n=1 Tax=Acer saccharum TaxID=4024 RepID=A0AA39SKN8_ACESA|nr:hypothetical protein LWI29_001228 [Acer saccharum]
MNIRRNEVDLVIRLSFCISLSLSLSRPLTHPPTQPLNPSSLLLSLNQPPPTLSLSQHSLSFHSIFSVVLRRIYFVHRRF